MRAIATAPHEFAANFLFINAGLNPFFAADNRVKAGDGSQVGQFTDEGERWIAKLYYQDSGILHPGEHIPSGTEFRIEELREFRLKIARHPEEDPVGEQNFNAHLSPRWQGMKAKKGNGQIVEISIPEGISEGVNVFVTGSNIEFDRYSRLLRLAAGSVDIAPRYFEDPHPHSNVQDAERYVRLHQDESGPVHARDGPIAALGHLLENDRSGYRKVVQNDADDHGNNLPGYYHTVTLGSKRISEAIPSHELPKEVKHYYIRQAANKPPEDPLAHPKVGASYQVNRWDGKIGVSSKEIKQLCEELEETVHAVLADAGITLAPTHGDGPYVEDAYFDIGTHDATEPTALDLTHIEQRQESVVIRHVADGMSPVEWEALETLVTDGGTVSPKQIADKNDRHLDSVYRALDRLEELIDCQYGEVALRSTYVAELVHDAVSEARESTRRAIETGAKAIEAAERGLNDAMQEWVAWCARYGVDISNRGDAIEIDLGDLDPHRDADPSFLIRRAYALWKAAKQDPERFRGAKVRYNGGSVRAYTLL